jgi:hypothetical protein
VFSSCDSSLAKTPFVVDLVDAWTASADRCRRFCGYGLLSEVARFTGRKAPDDGYFLAHVRRLGESMSAEGSAIQLAMAGALMSLGKRNVALNEAALRVARRVGPVAFESASGPGEPVDMVKHLTSDRLRQKLGLDDSPARRADRRR